MLTTRVPTDLDGAVAQTVAQARDAIPRAVERVESAAADYCRRELWARHKLAIIGGALLLVAFGILLAHSRSRAA